MKILNLHFKDREIIYTVSSQNKPSKVYALGKIELPENCIVKGKIVNFSALYRLLRKRLKATKISQKRVNVVFNDMQLFKKRVLIPKYIEEKDFRKFIDANLHNSILMPVKDPVYYYNPIDAVDSDNHHVMLYAMSDSNYLDYQRLFFELNMRIVNYSFESAALVDFNCYLGHDRRFAKKSVLLVDISTAQMNLTIFEDFAITYTVIADINTRELEDSSLDDVYNKKSILYKIYFEIEKVVNFYNVSTSKSIDVIFKSSYPLEDEYLRICADSLGANVSTLANKKVKSGKKLITDESYFKNFGVSSIGKKKRVNINLKFSKMKTYSLRLYAAFFISLAMIGLLFFESTKVIDTYYDLRSAEKNYENRNNDMFKLIEVNENIKDFNEFENIGNAIELVNSTEIDLLYILDNIARLRTSESKITAFNYSDVGEVSFTYTDTDVEVLKYVKRLENEKWILSASYNEMFYLDSKVEVRIILIVDKSLLVYSETRGDD